MSILHCELCSKDKNIFCPRDADAMCLICSMHLCGAHITEHLKNVHCVSLSLDHCSTKNQATKENADEQPNNHRH